jgi:hypothetical protein
MAFPIMTGNRRRAMSRAGCPCGDGAACLGRLPSVSLVMQLSTLGDKVRLRAPAVTIRLCDQCVRLLMTKKGRNARKALVQAVQYAAVELARRKRAADAA